MENFSKIILTCIIEKCLRSFMGVPRIDSVRNEEVLMRAGIERELASRVGQRVLKWFGSVWQKCISYYRTNRKVLMAEASEGQVRGRPMLGSINGV